MKKVIKTSKEPKDEVSTGRTLDPVTGFIPETDQDIIAKELIIGGESRAEIVERVTDLLDSETRRGNPKLVTTIVGNVVSKLLERGWTIESHFRMIPPKQD